MGLRLSGGRRLLSPPGQVARPTSSRVRLAVMNLLAEELKGARWLDLFCGSGVMGCEALQRGAKAVVAVDRDRRLCATALANLKATAEGRSQHQGQAGEPAVTVHCREVLHWLQRDPPRYTVSPDSRARFEIIYADPPYAAGLHLPVAQAVASGDWLAPGGRLLLEADSKNCPESPEGWRLLDQRRYGGTCLLILSL